MGWNLPGAANEDEQSQSVLYREENNQRDRALSPVAVEKVWKNIYVLS